MIKVLLIESDPKTRDIIEVGLDNFQVFEVDHAVDAWGVEMAKENTYDLIMVDIELANRTDGMEVVRQIREFDQGVEVIVVTKGKSSRLLSKEKAVSNIFALLSAPIEEQAFFKLIARARDRIESKKRKK
jgi:DNA-binding NtrC family response regulator